MANDLVKAVIKISTAIITAAFASKVASEGKKNVDSWQNSRKSFQQNSNKK